MKYFFALFASTATAFTVQTRYSPRIPLHLKSSPSHSETFERALDCAENFGVCDLDKMEELANELELLNGNYFEKDSELGAKEAADRKDVAEVLKMQSELRLRMEYLRDANLFAKDVLVMEESLPESQ